MQCDVVLVDIAVVVGKWVEGRSAAIRPRSALGQIFSVWISHAFRVGFHTLSWLSQLPVHRAVPSLVTPRHETRFS